jgi:DNA-binding NtrC family response regulator
MILENKSCLELADLPRSLGMAAPAGLAPPRREAPPTGATLEELERTAIVQALERAGRNQVRAAKLLGISRDTLRYRMRKFGLLAGSGTA